jgi:kynurenine formamidase
MTDTERPGAGPAARPPGQMTEAEFRSLYDRLRGQLPWGPDDRRGALNYITPAEILAAVGEPVLGRTVSLAAPVEHQPAADNPDPARHQMKGLPDAGAGPGLAFSMDRIAMNIHGNADSHIDALCHVIFDGTLYNEVAAAETVTAAGAAELSIGIAADGIVGRGVLLDVPRSRGVPWLEPGDHVTVADVLAAERDQGVRIGQGDIVLVRVGHRRRRTEQGPWDAAAARAGLHSAVLPLLAERRVAALGSDGNNDTAPSAVAGVDFPVHVLAVNALGLHLLDYLQFTELSQVCAEIGRWSFLCVIAPLRLPTGTGSPVNPIAIV